MKLLLPLMLLAASSVHAQSIDEARSLYDSARFAEAIAAYDGALESETLTRDEVLAILRGRALANLAASRESAADRDIRSLLSLDPDATLGDEAPPAVQQHVDELRVNAAPLATTGTAIPTSERWTVQVVVRGDVGRLVQRLAVYRRTPDGTFAPTDTAQRRVEYPPAATLTYYVVAYGPGDSVLTTHGTPDAPIVVDGGMEPVREPPPPIEQPPVIDDPPITDPPPPRNRRNLWIGLGAGGAALLVILIAVGVSAGGSNVTQPSSPVEVD